MSMIYYDMALFLNQEEKDYRTPLQQSAKMKLMSFKREGGVERVEVSAGGEGTCSECNQLDGKIFPIEDALEKMPLPFERCTNSMEHGTPGFCMCMYLPVL